ncbi:MAG TPA: NAD(P)/FAD-dependent oxidoreductase [Candidatus Polarisedimenticolia bacterium]|nr:NAD(P)/FAD-dependent oxidoreductase [Candidatus Polarisedimenticolia bacterium]
MSARQDVVILGGGLNSLVAAFDLARAGRRPVLLERRPVLGGIAVTEEIAPGFKAPRLMHLAGPLRPDLLADLNLTHHGLKWLESPVLMAAASPEGRPLVLHRDPKRSAESIAAFSKKDAERWPKFEEAVGRIAGAMGGLLDLIPPDIDKPAWKEVFPLLKTGKKVRDLGGRDLYRVLRWMPMAVADLAAEWFESEIVRAAIASRAILGQAAGPWSAGTAANYFLRAAADPRAIPSVVVPEGGIGALTQAIAAAAKAAGATLRTGVEVTGIEVKNGAVEAVRMTQGDRIEATSIVSGLDPKRTLLGLVAPADLDPAFRKKVQNIRARGVTAKVNLALGGLPDFKAFGSQAGAGTDGGSPLRGRILFGTSIDDLERAFDASKYGEISEHPYLEATLPTLLDPSLAPPGKHVLSVLVQYAPHALREGDWNARREELGERVVKTLAAAAPNLPDLIERGQVITPKDLEDDWGLTGGHLFHGEESLDQIFTMRPVLGWARYRTPVRGLYLCGSGTHPGGGLTGANGRNAARALLADRR